MDIVARLRQGVDPSEIFLAEQVMDSAADTIEFLRAQLARANSPVVDCRNSEET